MIVLGPGGLHTSIIPNLLVDGVCDALRKSRARKVFVVNLMNRKGQTTGYKTSHYMKEIVQFFGQDIFDHILMNRQKPPQEVIQLYSTEGELVESDMDDSRIIFANLLGKPRKI